VRRSRPAAPAAERQGVRLISDERIEEELSDAALPPLWHDILFRRGSPAFTTSSG